MENKDIEICETKYQLWDFVRFITSFDLANKWTIIKIEEKKPFFGKSYYIYYIHEWLEQLKIYNSVYRIREENIFSDSLDKNPYFKKDTHNTTS